MNKKLYAELLDNPPRFHWWANKEQVGGMGPKQLLSIEAGIESLGAEAPRVFIETGAGLSTVWALNLGMKVHSFVARREVVGKIAAFLTQYPELAKRWQPVVGYSELTLPLAVLGDSGLKAGMCLIDGGHGIQTVFVDFVYLNYVLCRDGLLLIDDLQLGSARLLADVLEQDRGYSALPGSDKLASFKKISEERLLPDWGDQEAVLDRIKRALSPREEARLKS